MTQPTRYALYIDGQLKAYSPISARSPYSSGNLSIGGELAYDVNDEDNISEFFRGQIGEVRVWNSTRTNAEIKELMTARLTPTPQFGLIAYYDMQDVAGTQQLNDLSGNSVHGSLGVNNIQNVYDPTWISRCSLTCTV